MKKSEPKMILNLSIENEEFEEKIKIAMEDYAEKIIYKNLDETVRKIVNKKIDQFLSSNTWSVDKMIEGEYFEHFVRRRTEGDIKKIIEKNIKDILTKKLSDILSETESGEQE